MPDWVFMLAFLVWIEIVFAAAILQKYCIRFFIIMHKDMLSFNTARLRRRVYAYWNGGDWEHTK